MKVSVVVPCYNCECHIEETLNSILGQSTKNVQIICVDNGSTDSTLNILDNYSLKFSNIEVYSESRAGANYARNTGLNKAKGEYIQFLDSDDTITKDKLEFQSKFMEENDLDVVVSDRTVYDEKLDKVLSIHEFSSINNNPLEVAVSEIIITGNPLYRTNYLKKIGGYRESLKYAQDWEFHIRLFSLAPKIGYLKGNFLKSRQLNNSLSNSNYLLVSDCACKIIKDNKELLIKNRIHNSSLGIKKIVNIYFESYIHSGSSDFKDELIFWYNKSNVINIFEGISRFIISVFGLKFYLYIKRLRKVKNHV